MALSNGALNLLSTYGSSSDESEEEIPGPRVSVKRTSSSIETCEKDSKRQATPHQKTRLPPPSALSKLFGDSNDENERLNDLSGDHGGRLRSFPHERGNWSSLVYIAVEPAVSLQSFIDVVFAKVDQSLNLQRSSDFHISLTKTVVLKHHWIDSISASVQNLARSISRFSICLGEIKVYTNEEKTRTFIGIVVTAGHETLTKVANELDKILRDFRLPSFYEEASFHLSIASCVGNHTNFLNSILPSLQASLDMFIHAQPLQWSLSVNKIHFKTGNKYFAYDFLL